MPTQVKFNMQDPEERARVKQILKDDDGDGGLGSSLQRALYRMWLKPLARPRGDQTQGGTIVPGLNDRQKLPSPEEAPSDSKGGNGSSSIN